MVKKFSLVAVLALGAVLGTAGAALAISTPPSATVSPAFVAGSYFHVGYAVTATKGTWTPATGVSFKYRWKQCDAEALICIDIPNATGLSYKPVAADAGKRVKFYVTATDAAQQSTTASTATATVGNSAPISTRDPAITAPYVHIGYLFGATAGDWDAPKPALKYQWQACGLELTCTNIVKATASSYRPVAADAGKHLRIAVTAANVTGGASTAFSALTAAVSAAAPVNGDTPMVTAPYRHVGYPFSATAGTWDAPNAVVKYQWQQCNDEGVSCVAIKGATAATYKPVALDGDKTLCVAVTAVNVLGLVSAPAVSQPTGIVSAAGPHNNEAPTVSAPFVHVGYLLTATKGSWDAGASTFRYQWQRSDGDTWSDIKGATAAGYKPVTLDGRKQLRVGVIAVNVVGVASTPAFSTPTDEISAAAPTVTDGPAATVSGFAHLGYTLSTTNGSWDTPGPTFRYQWYRCVDACVPIAGATTSTYKPVAADAGVKLVAGVAAVNAAGQVADFARSAKTDPVSNTLPQNLEQPEVSGTATVGQTLTATAGSWDMPSVTFSYQWQQCNYDGSGCANIGGATASTFKLTTAAAGKIVRVVVKATNPNKQLSAPSSSDPTDTVGPFAPFYTGGMTISDTSPYVGETLTVDEGTWLGKPAASFNFYQWYRCPASSTGDDTFVGCLAVDNRHAYTVTEADLGKKIRVRVVAANSVNLGHGLSHTSLPTEAVQAGAHSAEYLGDGGFDNYAPQVGDTITLDPGTWSGDPVFSYSWYACDSEPQDLPADLADCTQVGEESPVNEYVVAPDDDGKIIVGRVLGHVTGAQDGASYSTSIPVGFVWPASGPTFDGTMTLTTADPVVGSEVGLNVDGSWSGDETMTLSYQWQWCEVPNGVSASTCWDLNEETDSPTMYTPVANDRGVYLRVGVTAHDQTGTSETIWTGTSNAVVDAPPPPPTMPGFHGGMWLTVNGSPIIGVTTVGFNMDGVWSGDETLSFSYQWQRCSDNDLQVASCTDIDGATASTYAPVDHDAGMYLRALVTATDQSGTQAQFTDLTEVVVFAS